MNKYPKITKPKGNDYCEPIPTIMGIITGGFIIGSQYENICSSWGEALIIVWIGLLVFCFCRTFLRLAFLQDKNRGQ